MQRHPGIQRPRGDVLRSTLLTGPQPRQEHPDALPSRVATVMRQIAQRFAPQQGRDARKEKNPRSQQKDEPGNQSRNEPDEQCISVHGSHSSLSHHRAAGTVGRNAGSLNIGITSRCVQNVLSQKTEGRVSNPPLEGIAIGRQSRLDAARWMRIRRRATNRFTKSRYSSTVARMYSSSRNLSMMLLIS